MTWFHGTTARRFAVGDMLVPGSESRRYSNYLMVPGVSRQRDLESGRTVDMHDVVWICGDVDEAETWAQHSLLKATPVEIRRSPAGGVAVYEVEPVNLDVPVERHSASEAVCDRARVIRESRFEAFPLDLCDVCGEPATVGLGSDVQVCAECSSDLA